MDPLARFSEYAAAFEEAVRTDDWSGVEPFFTEDAVYEVTGSPDKIRALIASAVRNLHFDGVR